MKRGQYYRLLLATTADPTKVIAAAKTMSLHLSLATEQSSTKDSTGDSLEFDATGQSYDISGSALVYTPSDSLNTGANALNDMLGYIGDTPLYWRICLVEGTNNRTIKETICSGQAKLTSLNPSGQNKQNAQYSYTLNGYGGITVTADTSSSDL